MKNQLCTVWLALLVSWWLPAATPCRGQDEFADVIAPILQRHCLDCHNDQQRDGDFSLQTARSLDDSGHLVRGDASTSRLWQVISPDAGSVEMPQDSPPLSDTDVAAIARWIDGGADWPATLVLQPAEVADFDWWSYRPIEVPAIPTLDDRWIQTPIDAFVLQQLQQRGLTPAPVAERRTLIRRLSYDLTGLPPSHQAVEAFIHDRDPNAYEKLVDQLLASNHYGQRWARHWLDVVQYADTCGYDKDKLRPHAWPYRDYVVQSFDQDKPYRQFVQEQIAGDALFPNQPDGILGLGFIAAGPWDFIGHVEVPEAKIDGQVARNLDRDNMVANTFNTFCSLTVQCARCHHHKFDPITQSHYYGLQAVFAAVDRADRGYDPDPDVGLERRRLQTRLKTLQQQLQQHEQQAEDAVLRTLRESIATAQTDRSLQKPTAFGYHSTIATAADSTKWVELVLPAVTTVDTIQLNPCHDDFAGIGAGFGFPVRFRVEVTAAAPGDDAAVWTMVLDRTDHDYPSPSIAPVQITGIAQPLRRVRITATKLAPRDNDYIFALAEVRLLDRGGNPVTHPLTVDALDSIEAPPRWGKANLTDGLWPRLTDPAADQRLTTAVAQRDAHWTAVRDADYHQHDASLKAQIEQTRQSLQQLPTASMVYAAATDFPEQGHFRPTGGRARTVHVLHRGNVDQPREPAAPGMLPLSPDSIVALDADLPESQRRAALARWLTDPQHPLVWRSIANRIWQYHFGSGIVATPNDFGRMGSTPTHPALLDWLADQLRRGQSIKRLHRMIVTSSVYQQSSTWDQTQAAIDGGNQWLWRMNRRRLEAEEIRDSILVAADALDRDMGGPGFYLFQLEKPEHSPHYQYHKFDPADPRTHRRSIYRFIVRSQPNPWMTTLDCADSSQSTPRRSETLTSLQALSLMNNRFVLVMSQQFAARLQRETPLLSDQVDLAMQCIVQRTPTAIEHDEMTEYARQHGLANLCRWMFNLSEFVYLD